MGGRNTGQSACPESGLLRRGLSALGSAIVMMWAHSAYAGSPQSLACAAAAERGQAMRDDGNLLAARAAFGECIRPECPTIIATECARWIDDVVARQPSVVVAVRDERGSDVVDATIEIDGQRRDDAAKGRAIVLDPGQHVVTARLGRATLSQTIVLREREKDRPLLLEPAKPTPRAASAVPSPTARALEDRPVPIVTYVLAGVGVVLGSIGAGFAVSSADAYAELERSCPSRCTEADLLGLRAKTVTADIAISLASVAAVGSLVVYLVRPTVVRPAAVAPRQAGVDWLSGTVRF